MPAWAATTGGGGPRPPGDPNVTHGARAPTTPSPRSLPTIPRCSHVHSDTNAHVRQNYEGLVPAAQHDKDWSIEDDALRAILKVLEDVDFKTFRHRPQRDRDGGVSELCGRFLPRWARLFEFNAFIRLFGRWKKRWAGPG